MILRQLLVLSQMGFFILSGQVLASTPPNHLSYPASAKSNKLMDNSLFEMILANFERWASGEVSRVMSKKLFIQADWENAEVNAYATRDDDNNPIIVLKGGMARHPKMSPTGLMLILCHELGHFLGGAPKKLRGRSDRRSWSSAEGQADYYATSKCAKRLFEGNLFEMIKAPVPQGELGVFLSALCSDDAKCIQIALASQSISQVFASMRWGGAQVSLQTKDPTIVGETTYKHPRSQCRLDTLVAGLKCPISSDIPFDNLDPKAGACHTQSKDPLPSYSRPACWWAN